jgi:serine/threonine protein kinase
MEYLGKGAYGCVVSPPPACSSSKKSKYVKNGSYVAKLFADKRSWKIEIEQNKLVQKLFPKGANNWLLISEETCSNVDKSTISNTVLDRCGKKHASRDLAHIIYPNGGVNFETMLNQMKLPKLSKVLVNLVPIFKGIAAFSKKGYIHNDIKLENIVIEPKTLRCRVIDLGLMLSKQDVVNRSYKAYFTSSNYMYYPPEYRIHMSNANDVEKTIDNILEFTNILRQHSPRFDKIRKTVGDEYLGLNREAFLKSMREMLETKQKYEYQVRTDVYSLGLFLAECYGYWKEDDIDLTALQTTNLLAFIKLSIEPNVFKRMDEAQAASMYERMIADLVPGISEASVAAASASASASSASESVASIASMEYKSSESSGSSDSPTEKQAVECFRKKTNWAKMNKIFQFDDPGFQPELVAYYMRLYAPKMAAIIDKIRECDERDLSTIGKLHKHVIYSDVIDSSFGAKAMVSCLVASGFHSVQKKFGQGMAVSNESTLIETRRENVSLLCSKPTFGAPFPTQARKKILQLYNKRPENIYGDLIRIIVIDQGYREGIDLFDVKYVHLLDPIVVTSNEKQAVGRSTRFCGQRGLQFAPSEGWTLNVFRYDLNMNEKISEAVSVNVQNAVYRFKDVKGQRRFMDLYKNLLGPSLKLINFANELEEVCIDAAVDKDLTHNIHSFTVNSSGGAAIPNPPTERLTSQEMQEYVKSNYGSSKLYKYKKPKMENLCDSSAAAASGDYGLITLSASQEFVRRYFVPETPYKGMLLWHSVGTGKTCSGIAVASSSFEKEGYTVLWVTRHTLRADVQKNLYGLTCHDEIRKRIKNHEFKSAQAKAKGSKIVKKHWMDIVSYKTFTNFLRKKNSLYKKMVTVNGMDDPLKKTLIIIDEAHKLYDPNAPAQEKPNMKTFTKWIRNSYARSGNDSVRLLIMTATPYTVNPMEFMKLINLTKEDSLLPTEFDEFAAGYLDGDGHFTKKGKTLFQNSIAGQVSYLNRSSDARNFAYPIWNEVVVDMTHPHMGDNFYIHQQSKNLRMENKQMIAKKKYEVKSVKANDDYITRCNDEANGKPSGVECKNEIKQKLADLMAKKKEIAAEKKMRMSQCPKGKDGKDCKSAVLEWFDNENTALLEEIEDMKRSEKDALKQCDYLKECLKAGKKAALLDAKEVANKYKEDIADNKSKIFANVQRLKESSGESVKQEMRELREKIKILISKIKSARHYMHDLKKKMIRDFEKHVNENARDGVKISKSGFIREHSDYGKFIENRFLYNNYKRDVDTHKYLLKMKRNIATKSLVKDSVIDGLRSCKVKTENMVLDVAKFEPDDYLNLKEEREKRAMERMAKNNSDREEQLE